MQFHDYVSVKTRYTRAWKDPGYQRRLRGMKADKLREKMIAQYSAEMEREGNDSDVYRHLVQMADMEQEWVNALRPYYNFWPVSISLARSVRLELPMKSIELPSTAMLLRFPRGNEPYSIGTAMLYCDRELRLFSVHCHVARSDKDFWFYGPYNSDESFEGFLGRYLAMDLALDQWDELTNANFDLPKASGLMLRLAVFVSLLSRGDDLVTPVILSKDQAKYEQTEDEEVKRWLEDRAARRMMGRGFDVGKKLQVAKDQSPHWRNPHLALFWTGEGRTVPVIKLRSGSIVQRASIAEVPTGYFGPETEKDDEIPPEATPRDGISKSRRYDLMKRDEFRCQLCGASHEHGAVLHVDHKVALAKGGSNLDENLWTLCEKCNLGKSDKSL